jgi:hypothetical protein
MKIMVCKLLDRFDLEVNEKVTLVVGLVLFAGPKDENLVKLKLRK